MNRPDSVSKLDSHLGYWLRAVSNQVSHAFAAKLAATDITVAEWVVMRSLFDQPPMAPSVLADRLGLTRGAVTKLADRLIAKSMLVRRANPDDARSHTLALTARGARRVPGLAKLADENDADFFGRITPAERRTLEHLLRRMADAFGVASPPMD